jgi:hypothetical protein
LSVYAKKTVRSLLVKVENPEICELLGKIYKWGGLCTAVCFCVTLFWGFEWKNLLGFAAGYGYMCFCIGYLGRTCERAVRLDKKSAGRAMTACYAVRYGGLFILCSAGVLTGIFSFAGVLVPQFYPKIILSVIQFKGKG